MLAVAQQDSPEANRALEELCRAYWYPIYAFIRRSGYSIEDAEDLTQSFFARVLEEKFIAGADRTKGRFRAYLLTRLKHFLADDWDKQNAQKRGAGKKIISLENGAGETKYKLEAVDRHSPDKLFEYRWAITLIERVYERLQKEYKCSGNSELFHALKDCLVQARAAVNYPDVSKILGLTEGALRVAVHRLRQRYRQLLREEIADTVQNPEEIEDELMSLFRILSE